jgi:flagellar hook-length control protein FliK
MANQKLQRAEIKMNPPQLGPIEVRLNISGDQAQVHFTAQHGVVRDALESALPRLREMFGANGLDLVDVNVADQSETGKRGFAQASENGGNGPFGNEVGVTEDDDSEVISGQNVLNTSTPMGVIDYFV